MNALFKTMVKNTWSTLTSNCASLALYVATDNRSRLLSELTLEVQKQIEGYEHLTEDEFAGFESQIDMLSDHMLLVEKTAAQLDNNNVIDHTPLVTVELQFLFENVGVDVKAGKSLLNAFRKYTAAFPEKELRSTLNCAKPKSFKDEVAKYMEEMQEKSRKNQVTQKVLNEMRNAHHKGWFFIFDTLTLADDRLAAFNEDENALRDYFRSVGRKVLEAEGRSVRGSYDDCYRYLAVPEFGGQNGRLHWHVVHMVRTLPRGSFDPNFGRKVRNYRQINSFRGLWKYGFTQPIAVRYQHDAFSRLGWLWPVDKNGKAVQSKPYQAVAWYVTKYVSKQSDQRQRAIRERQQKCKNPLMTVCLSKNFRVRSSRRLGMEMLSMKHLSERALLDLTRISMDSSPIYHVVKVNAKRELMRRLAKEDLQSIIEARPIVVSMLKLLRRLKKTTPEFNLQNSIALMTDTLSVGDISDEARQYLSDARVTHYDFRAKATKTFGGK